MALGRYVRIFTPANIRKAKKKLYMKGKPKTTKPKLVNAINPANYPIGRSVMTRLKYNDRYTIGVSSLVQSRSWNINSIFDPDQTGTGHQPYGHDLLATAFNRYRVYKVEVEFTVHSAATSLIPVEVVFVVNNSTTITSTLNLAGELPYAKTFAVTPDNPAKFKKTYTLSAVTGVAKSEYDTDDRFQAVFGTNPSEKILLHMVYSTPSGTPNIYVNATINYVTKCFDPLDMSQS